MREALPDGVNLCVFRIEANAFLYRMVRTTVAALIEIGLGRMTIDQFMEIFQARDRGRIGLLAPAHGLTLVAVKYNDLGGRRPPEHIEK
jgi:tRNA pseudouridine38-40 synthase